MKREANCIFCKIVAGEVPSFKLFEDATVLAFMDINPANEGHCLVIPKNHFETLYDAPAGEVGRVAEIATRVAKAVASVLKPEGLNLIQANGAAAAQSVMHFHMHVLPRRPGDDLKLNWGLKPGNREAIALLAEKLKARLA
ncbi:MAG TPA: HIT family protein [Alphaproteobacteria bacterium]|nr:HIT family protein [Alphaproteobacteria bacterium]